MLTLFCGPAGTGKTQAVFNEIEKRLKDGKKTKMYVIVTEQESVKSEKALLERFGNTLNERVEILNFSRLANRVFREAGGITYSYIDSGGKDLIVSTVLEDAKESFSSFETFVDDESFISALRGELDRMRLGGVGADELLSLSADISKKEMNSRDLCDKMQQLSSFYSLYEGTLRHSGVDAIDDLNRLAQTLEDYDFFYNTTVFIDGFYDFTHPEYLIIERIISSGADVFLTLPLTEHDPEEIFLKSREAKKRLEDIAEKTKTALECVYLTERRRVQAMPLAYIADCIREGKRPMGEEKIPTDGALTLTSCQTPFDECVYVAGEIVRLVKSGVKFREIAVCTGNAEDYGTMLEDVFENYGIKFLSNSHDTLFKKALASFILLSLDAVSSGFYLPKMKRYLESPLLPLDEDKRFALSNYITTWNINFSLWQGENDWVMNPRGYVETISSEEKEELEQVNSARRTVAVPLIKLSEGLKKPSVSDKVRAVWEYLSELCVYKTVTERSDYFRKVGNTLKADDEISVWNLTLECLDRLVDTLGKREVSVDRFIKYMRVVFRDSSFGHIPSSLDEVEIGDIGFIRNSDVKHLFFIGFNEGAFPKAAPDSGIFTENERHVLERFSDFFKADSSERVLQNEVFCLLVALSCPRDALHLVYHTSSGDSSDERVSFFAPVIASYAHVEEKVFSLSDSFPVTREELASWAVTFRDADNYDELIQALEYLDPDFAKEVSERALKGVFSSENLRLAKAPDMFRDKINMTQARLDTFSRCPFAYYSNYLLSLKTRKKAQFKAAEMGSLVHKVLEDVLARLSGENKKLYETEREEIEAVARDCAQKYLRVTAPEISDTSRRFKYLTSRLTSFVVYVLDNMREEFENSDFSPILFEENMEEGGAIEPYKVELEGGSSLVFYGCVDRVDLYEDEKGHKYLRVVDYKTKIGGKKFDLNDVINGINLQLLVYLFAIWQNGEKDKASPAGIMYMPASRPSVTLANLGMVEEEKDARDEGMKRSGLFLFDEKVLSAMEHGLEGRVLPIKRNKNGTFSSSASLATLEQFGALKRYTDKTFMNLADKLREGHISAAPLCSSTLDSCKWCDFKPFCRYEGEGREYVKVDKPWDEITDLS